MTADAVFNLRGFIPYDLDRVIAVNKACLPENYPPSFFMNNYQNCPTAFMAAEADDRIVGYVMCRVENAASSIGRTLFIRRGHLVSIAVLQEYRRRGIATELAKRAMNALKKDGVRDCYLEVRPTNEAAILLYKKLGFSSTSRVTGYYTDGEEALVMVAPLTRASNTTEESDVDKKR